MRGNLMERINQIERGKHPFFAQGVQAPVHAGDGKVADAATLLESLVVNGDPNARILGGRVLDQACREVLLQG